MKILKPFILVSLLFPAAQSLACGPYYSAPEDMNIYRLLPYGKELRYYDPYFDNFRVKNILLWSKQTGFKDTTLIRDDIYSSWPPEQWEECLKSEQYGELYSGQYESRGVLAGNPFPQHLINSHDEDAIRLLYWSKLYESIRDAQRSPWYYCKGLSGEEHMELSDLADSAMAHTKGKYRDRYIFLAIKSLWASRRFEECIEFYNKHNRHLQNTIFHAPADDYYARCLCEVGRDDEAVKIYLRRGDVTSLSCITGGSLPRMLEMVGKASPNSPMLAMELQRVLHTLENNYYYFDQHLANASDYYDADSLLPVVLRFADNPRQPNRALWQYTAACLLDYMGEPAKGLRYLRNANSADPFLSQSIRVLRFYLRSKTDPVGNKLEQYAIGEVQWMDSILCKEWEQLTSKERTLLLKNMMPWCNYSIRCCYMYDAMRRIMLPDSVGLCSRLAAAGRTTRALQMANIADNRIHILARNTPSCNGKKLEKYEWWWSEYKHKGASTYIWINEKKDTTCYTLEAASMNNYRNAMFLLADGMTARQLERYRQRQLRPQDTIDRWFNERGHTDSDYWQDIIGTHYIRERNYNAAIAHLKYVSSRYQLRMNVECAFDPFGIDRSQKSNDSTRYKLHFAERMRSLEWRMNHGDADSRGLAMLEYSIGLRNSFDRCWELTTYGVNGYENDRYYSKRDFKANHSWGTPDPQGFMAEHLAVYAPTAFADADSLQKRAFRTLQSDEARAKYELRLRNFATIKKRYANTETGRHIALVCDERGLYQGWLIKNNWQKKI